MKKKRILTGAALLKSLRNKTKMSIEKEGKGFVLRILQHDERGVPRAAMMSYVTKATLKGIIELIQLALQEPPK